MTLLQIRHARADEAQALSELCKRSKAHWGYDAPFLNMAEAALTISPEAIEAGQVLVAETGVGVPVGVAAVAPMATRGDIDLVQLFVAPPHIKSGAGRTLFDAAAALARAMGGRRLVILSDPHATAFYERMGAVRAGDAPSDSIPGRRLPLLYFTRG